MKATFSSYFDDLELRNSVSKITLTFPLNQSSSTSSDIQKDDAELDNSVKIEHAFDFMHLGLQLASILEYKTMCLTILFPIHIVTKY